MQHLSHEVLTSVNSRATQDGKDMGGVWTGTHGAIWDARRRGEADLQRKRGPNHGSNRLDDAATILVVVGRSAHGLVQLRAHNKSACRQLHTSAAQKEIKWMLRPRLQLVNVWLRWS